MSDVPKFKVGRTCKYCHKLLSMYNPTSYCFIHSDANRKILDEEARKKELSNNKKTNYVSKKRRKKNGKKVHL